MAKKTPPNYYYRYNRLIGWGLLPFEAREIARTYSMQQIRTLPYLQSLIRARRLYISNLRSRNYPDREIIDRIYALYDRKDWLDDNGRPSIWEMLRSYRKSSIEDNDYIPPKRKGSHHKGGISKGDVAGQKARRRKKTPLEKYDEGRMR